MARLIEGRLLPQVPNQTRDGMVLRWHRADKRLDYSVSVTPQRPSRDNP